MFEGDLAEKMRSELYIVGYVAQYDFSYKQFRMFVY